MPCVHRDAIPNWENKNKGKHRMEKKKEKK
jgi:hypothetical protein